MWFGMGVILIGVLMSMASAQTATVRVQVRSDGKPVAGAAVVANGVTHATDAEGIATVTAASGGVTIAVVREGFPPATTSVQLQAGQQQTVIIDLTPQPTHEERITVSATRGDRRLEDLPMRVEVLAREEIEEKMLMTPGDIVMMQSLTEVDDDGWADLPRRGHEQGNEIDHAAHCAGTIQRGRHALDHFYLAQVHRRDLQQPQAAHLSEQRQAVRQKPRIPSTHPLNADTCCAQGRGCGLHPPAGARSSQRWGRRAPFALTGTYTFVNARESEAGQRTAVALTPRHSAGLVGMMEAEDAGRVGIEVYYTGRQRLEYNPSGKSAGPM